ncbi:hypothetical protein KYC5002_10365 [Archangium violaceum]|uniref:hypothetical protein n=1 Tax=Archangium violaceum TaxID=83451 RepID=UPI002B299EEE|nr:hypothetical protein KYC5002_10365 [Archangium gephyra]
MNWLPPGTGTIARGRGASVAPTGWMPQSGARTFTWTSTKYSGASSTVRVMRKSPVCMGAR